MKPNFNDIFHYIAIVKFLPVLISVYTFSVFCFDTLTFPIVAKIMSLQAKVLISLGVVYGSQNKTRNQHAHTLINLIFVSFERPIIFHLTLISGREDINDIQSYK